MAPGKFAEVEVRLLREAGDYEGRRYGLDAAQLAGLAVVDGVGGDEEGQQPGVRGLHAAEGRVVEPGPAAVDDGAAAVLDDLLVEWAHALKYAGYDGITEFEKNFYKNLVMEMVWVLFFFLYNHDLTIPVIAD